MLTNKGMEILSDLYKEFREDWLGWFPESNENDVERAFLYSVYSGTNDGTHYVPPSLQEKIESIR